MKLYQFPPSPNAIKVVVAAHELGLDGLDLELIDLSKGAQLADDYVSLNPNHMIPTLEDDGFVLWESNAIMQYLANRAGGGQTLWPSDPQGQADVSRWQCWQLAHWGSACGTLTFERLVRPMIHKEEPDAAACADGEERFNRFAAVLDGHLKGRDFLVGDSITLADISVGAPLVHAAMAQFPLDGRDELNRWWGGLMGRASFQKAIAAIQM